MKIALLSFEYPPETGFGGIGTYTWHHARALVQLGHEVHVIAGSTQPSALHTQERDGVFLHRFRARGFWMRLFRLFGFFQLHWTEQRLENGWSMYLALKMLMREHTFDILEMPECGAEGLFVNRWIETPRVVRFHSPSRLIMPFYNVPRLDFLLCSWLEQIAISRATALTSCSTFLAAEAREKLDVKEPITIIPNGIDMALFEQEPTDSAHIEGLPEGKVTVLFAGRMERRKGIHLCGDIVKSILHDRNVVFLFAGEDLFGYLATTLLPSLTTKQHRESVRYLGKLNAEELRSWVRSVDILLLPSLWESCSYSCLEAMAAGRATVSANQGGMPELIQHGRNGLLAEPGSPKSFVSNLDKLIDDRDLRETLGAAARQTVQQRYTHLQTARWTEAVYQQCLSRSQISTHADGLRWRFLSRSSLRRRSGVRRF